MTDLEKKTDFDRPLKIDPTHPDIAVITSIGTGVGPLAGEFRERLAEISRTREPNATSD